MSKAPKDPLLYISHIIDAITAIERQTKGVTRKEFENSEVLQGFIERKLEIIGEATKNISSDFKREHPGIPWKDMAGMRDILIHQYSTIDENIVWKTATEKALPVKKQIEEIANNI